MLNTDRTCEYVLDPDDPETWGGEEGDVCHVDEKVLNEDGVWTCPHDTEEGDKLCIFHLPIDSKDDEKVTEKFFDALDETPESSHAPETEQKSQLLGATFGKLNFDDDVVADSAGGLNLSYSTIETVDTSGVEFRVGVNLTGSEIEGAMFNYTTFRKFTKFRYANFGETQFVNTEFTGNVDFAGAEFRGHSNFSMAKFNGETDFFETTFWGPADFHSGEFRGKTNLRDIRFSHSADFSFAEFEEDVGFDITEFIGEAKFIGTEFGKCVSFSGADFGEKQDFSGAIFDRKANFSEIQFGDKTDFSRADLTNATFTDACLHEANFQSALLNRATLYRTDLRGAKLSGTVLGDVRIDEDTKFLGLPSDDSDTSPHTLSAIRSRSTCVYDPDYGKSRDSILSRVRNRLPSLFFSKDSTDEANDEADVDKAKSVYRALEELGGKHARPRLQARSFVRRQDLQKQDYWDDATADDASLEERFIAGARWSRAKMARATLLYGESPWRVIAWSLGIILSFALLYPLGGWMKAEEANEPLSYSQIPASFLSEPLGWFGGFLNILADSLYYSTLTYTALGFGDFQPEGFGRLLTTVETGFGAVMLALLVFILGRRAAR